jgi:hypothetical protein
MEISATPGSASFNPANAAHVGVEKINENMRQTARATSPRAEV